MLSEMHLVFFRQILAHAQWSLLYAEQRGNVFSEKRTEKHFKRKKYKKAELTPGLARDRAATW